MNIGQRRIAPDQPPYIIAEIGVNHDGCVDRALELTDAAHDAGADAIKLQFFEAGRLLSKAARLAAYQADGGAGDPFTMLHRLELTVEQMHDIVDRAHQRDLHAIVTVFSVELVAAANELSWDAYKTASPDVINKPLLDALMQTERPLLVSTGASRPEEVADAVRWLGDYPHLMFHCVSAYPTPDDQAALAGREALVELDPCALGYSDHTVSIDTGAFAVAGGACALEKHLTYDRSAAGPDHATSLDPAGFAEYVRLAHRAHTMRGVARKVVGDVEQDVRQVSRQSLVTRTDLPAGHVLRQQDITIKRPGDGLPPAALDDVIGRTLRCAVESDMPLRREHLA